MIALYVSLELIAGFVVGFEERELRELAKRLRKLEEKPMPKTAGVTMGSYRPANETKQTSAVITPKTPQQLEYLANDRMRKEGLDVGNRQR